jgi:CRP/FNR family transcriptional regulator, anaerobic regulatory protein
VVDPGRAAEGMCRPEIETLLRDGANAFLAALEPAPVPLETGDPLMQMGEAHEYLYVVEQGWLARSRTIEDGRRQIIVVFLPGDTCGIKTMFQRQQPDAIEALTPASARRIHYRDALALAAREFPVSLHLAWQLARDERHLHNWNVLLGRANAEERLAALLLEIRDRLAARGAGDGRRYPLPITQQQMADHVGLTVVHVNRVLRRFRELEMVSVQRGSMVFLDNLAELEALARPLQDLTV